ncbi:MAG: hypothetical protein ACI3YK_03660 [Eubacteriales bacterium]
MKKLSFALAMILALTAFAGCNNDEPASTTTGDSSTTSATTTSSATTTTAPSSSANPTEAAPSSEEEEEDPREIMPLVCGKSGDLALEGYEANGYWIEEDGKMICDYGNPPVGSMFVVTNDTMSAGTLEATFTSVADSTQNDNGIVFCIGENVGEDSYYNYFWEDPSYTPPYYFLFVSDASTLYLAKVASGVAWTVLANAEGQEIPGYAHGLSVTIKVEFDGQGHIQCYANDLLIIDYQDPNPLTGDRYGIRAEVAGVSYESVIATHD